MATTEEQIAQHEENIRVIQAEVDRLRGGPVPSDLASKHKRQDEEATLFERSTPAERLELYQTNREQWQAMLDAHEEAGMRKLLGS